MVLKAMYDTPPEFGHCAVTVTVCEAVVHPVVTVDQTPLAGLLVASGLPDEESVKLVPQP